MGRGEVPFISHLLAVDLLIDGFANNPYKQIRIYTTVLSVFTKGGDIKYAKVLPNVKKQIHFDIENHCEE